MSYGKGQLIIMLKKIDEEATLMFGGILRKHGHEPNV